MPAPLLPITVRPPQGQPVISNVEFRVVVQGLKLDDGTKTLIDAAIKSVVLHELASLNTVIDSVTSPRQDPATRSLLGLGLDILGLVIVKNDVNNTTV